MPWSISLPSSNRTGRKNASTSETESLGASVGQNRWTPKRMMLLVTQIVVTNFIALHVLTKNLQSIRTPDRFMDFMSELANGSFDILFVSETWREHTEEIVDNSWGCRLYLAGGGGHQGVGIVASRALLNDMHSISFHAFSARFCMLKFCIEYRWFTLIAVYLPTNWASDVEVWGLYDLLSLALSQNCGGDGVTILGGDFNASIGHWCAGDDLCSGDWGMGFRNERGNTLLKWVAEHNLQILSRMNGTGHMSDSWTCRRALDGALVQLDLLICWIGSSLRAQVGQD